MAIFSYNYGPNTSKYILVFLHLLIVWISNLWILKCLQWESIVKTRFVNVILTVNAANPLLDESKLSKLTAQLAAHPAGGPSHCSAPPTSEFSDLTAAPGCFELLDDDCRNTTVKSLIINSVTQPHDDLFFLN